MKLYKHVLTSEGDAMKLETLIRKLGIRMVAARVDTRPKNAGADEWGASAHHFRVTLSREGRRMRLYFSQGSAHTDPPTTAHVLDCLANDASGIENARGDFAEWCSEYGMDADSRSAERVFKACERQTRALRRVIGDDTALETLLYQTEQM